MELLNEIWEKKAFIVKATLATTAFWLVELALQLYVVGAESFDAAVIRSLAFAGATLIGASLIIGPVAVLMPRWNFVQYRRAIGVGGFVLATVHGLLVLTTYFGGSLMNLPWGADPFKMPIFFGVFASWLLYPLFFTSTDWAMRKLGSHWKTVHRLVYFAFLLIVLHFMAINPGAMATIPGYALLFVTAVAILLQMAGFFKRWLKARTMIAGVFAGAVILAWLAGLYLYYVANPIGG
jgi:DMSO/TMAO reductase YedYZ heme-binding membrane subunit